MLWKLHCHKVLRAVAEELAGSQSTLDICATEQQWSWVASCVLSVVAHGLDAPPPESGGNIAKFTSGN